MIEKSWMKRWGHMTSWSGQTETSLEESYTMRNHSTGKRLGVRKQQIYTRIGKEGWTDGSAIKGSQPRQEEEQRNKPREENSICAK